MARTVPLEEARAETGRAIRLPAYLPAGIPSEPVVKLSEPPDEPAGGVTITYERDRESLGPGDIFNVQVVCGEGEMSLRKYGPRIGVFKGVEVQVHAFDPHQGLSMVMSCWNENEEAHGLSISWIAPGPSKEDMMNLCATVVASIISQEMASG